MSSLGPYTGQIPGAQASPRILLVDDDIINQKVVMGLIRRRGWEAVPAASGKQSLELLEREHFDLVLMDIQMPELDGFQTAMLIRQREADHTRGTEPDAIPGIAERRVPIVALTTVVVPGTRERCLESGMDDYLSKPVNTDALYEVVTRVLALPH